MKVHTFTTIPTRPGDLITVYQIIPERVLWLVVYRVKATTGDHPSIYLNSLGRECLDTHGMFYFHAAMSSIRRHNRANNDHKIIQQK